MSLSKFDSYYDRINELMKKKLFDRIDLDGDELAELKSFLKNFGEIECREDDFCRATTCRFAGTPDDWVLYFGFEDLCDLIVDYYNNNGKLKRPKGDLLDAKNLRIPGHGFGKS